MAISGNLRISASLVSPYHNHPKCLSLPSSKVDFTSNVANSFEKQKVSISLGNRRGEAKVLARNNTTAGDYELSPSPVQQEVESFLLNAINMSFFDRLNLAWKIVFPSHASRRSSNARIAKQRLKMILFSDRCDVSDEAKRKIVNNIVHALSDFVEIESEEKVQLNVSTDGDIGTIYSVTVPVRRVKAEYQDVDEAGSITNVEYKDTVDGSVDVSDDCLGQASEYASPPSNCFENFEREMSGGGAGLELEDAISKIKFSPESNNLLIASWDSYLRLYNVETSSLILKLCTRASLLDCCFENESTSYTSDSDGFIQRYDLNAGTVDTIGRHDDIATSVLFSFDKGEVISTGLDEKIRFWDTRRRLGQSLVLSTDAGGAAVRCITVNGNNLVVCVDDASMRLYDLRSLDRPFQSCESQVEVPIRCVTSVPFSTAGYAVGSVDGQVALEFPNTACSTEMKYTFRCHPKSMKGRLDGACINAIEFTPGGLGTFVTGDNEGYVISWNAKSRRRLFELPTYSNSVASLAFNHTGELLAVASSHTYQEAKEKEEPPQVFIHKF